MPNRTLDDLRLAVYLAGRPEDLAERGCISARAIYKFRSGGVRRPHHLAEIIRICKLETEYEILLRQER